MWVNKTHFHKTLETEQQKYPPQSEDRQSCHLYKQEKNPLKWFHMCYICSDKTIKRKRIYQIPLRIKWYTWDAENKMCNWEFYDCERKTNPLFGMFVMSLFYISMGYSIDICYLLKDWLKCSNVMRQLFIFATKYQSVCRK